MLPAFAWVGNLLAQACHPRRRTQPSTPAATRPLRQPNLAQLARPTAVLPDFVAHDPIARKYLALLGPLDWEHFPERPTNQPWPGPTPAPRAPYVAAFLVKLNEGLRSLGHLRRYLVEHPALVWCLGFPLSPDPTAPHGLAVERSLPSRRQLGRVLRELDNAAAQFLLDSTVQLLHQALPAELNFGDVIALDTKHILAWVQENNPKQYVADRYNKTRQPKGDPDCKLGCKKRRNKGEGNGAAAPATPSNEATPASQTTVGEYHWGYASGVVSTKAPDWGEFVLAELTQTFDKSDPSYFFPLMAATERRLGRRPHYGALDKAFDAFYVYQYFHDGRWLCRRALQREGRPEGPPVQP